MKKLLCWIASSLLIIGQCLLISPSPLHAAVKNLPQTTNRARCLFVSVIQEPGVLSSREEIMQLIAFAAQAHAQTLFIQVYRANKAWFPSKVGDATPHDECFKNVGTDPLALLIREAHSAGIQVHAWINLLSLSKNEKAPLLKKYGTSILTRNLKSKKELKDYQIDEQYFLEPGDTRIRKELLTLIEELLRAYPDLDGIQFDYIRYPDSHPAYGYTDINVERFKHATGLDKVDEQTPAWKNWKRQQVTELLQRLADKARSIRPGLQVSATGCMSYARAYHEAFQDWPGWLKSGLVDFVTIMSYSRHTSTLARYIWEARKQTGSLEKINIGIGAYEMVHSPDRFKQQWIFCEKAGGRACAVFHYGSLLENPELQTTLLDARRKNQER